MKLLLIEDDKKIATAVKRGLEGDGFSVEVAFDGTDGLWMATEGSYDILIVDLMLPGENGFVICRELRERQIWTPILVLTAKDGHLDEAEALDTGADDYLTKPFSYPVLVARLRALLRRTTGQNPVPLSLGDLRVDPGARRAWRGETEIELTARQFEVLEFLVRRAGQVMSKAEILAGVWETDFDGDPNIVEVYIGRLRARIDQPFGRHAIVLALVAVALVVLVRRQLFDNLDNSLSQRADTYETSFREEDEEDIPLLLNSNDEDRSSTRPSAP